MDINIVPGFRALSHYRDFCTAQIDERSDPEQRSVRGLRNRNLPEVEIAKERQLDRCATIYGHFQIIRSRLTDQRTLQIKAALSYGSKDFRVKKSKSTDWRWPRRSAMAVPLYKVK
jgi:hypothetical protein